MRMPVPSLGRGGLVAALARTAPGTALLVAAIVFLAALVLTSAAMWFGRAADAGLPALLGSVPAGQRGLEFEQYGRLWTAGSSPMATVTAAGDVIERMVPADVAGILGKRMDLVDTAEYQVPDASELSRLALRIQPSVDTGIRFVQGGPPTGRVGTEKTPDRTPAASGNAPGGSAGTVDTTVLELAVPFADLGLAADEPVAFFVAVFDEAGAELERHPAHRPIELVTPDALFEARHWRA